jgi:DNA-binding transcriptional ArsR family regulator
MLDPVLTALAEPRRRQILETLLSGEQTAGDLAALFPDVSRPAVSQHLRVLEEAGLVQVRKSGVRRFYSLDLAGFDELRGFLEEFWTDRLANLKRLVEEERRKPDEN